MSHTVIAFMEKYTGLILCWFLTVIRTALCLFSSKKIELPSKKIVFVKFIEQGALVLHLPTFEEAAREYGAENIFLCTFGSNAQLADIVKPVPNENRIFINEQNIFRFALGFLAALRTIRKNNIDTVIDLEFFSRATAVFCYLTGACKRVGYHRYEGLQNYRGNLFTHRLNYSHYVSVGESSWSLLKSIELPVKNLPALDILRNNPLAEISFTPTADSLNHLSELLGYNLSELADSIVINLSLNDALPLRKWPAESYREFIYAFHQIFPSYKFIFTGRKDEYELTAGFMDNLQIPGTINLCGKTDLQDILTLYSCSKILLTSDSGPAHFAAITCIETIVLFGPETPVLYAPLSQRTHVIYEPPPCSPCYNVYNNRISACTNNICMQRISVDAVLQKAKEILAPLS